jgi:hypothetical protein
MERDVSEAKHTATDVLRKIAEMPLSKDFDYDERGEIVSGSNSYGPNWAAWHFQQLAKQFLAKAEPRS